MKKTLFNLAKTPLGEIIVGIAFGKLSKLIPVDRVKETDKVLAFYHPKPYWENHILLVPKKSIKSLDKISDSDLSYIEEVFRVAQEIILEKGWDKSDYQIITNGGSRQEIAQLHFHLAQGKVLKQ